MNITKLKHPTAFLPILMSLTALTIVLGHIVVSGIAREADEGTAAHLFQLLMAGQAPIIAFFALKWLPREPRQATPILALQVGVALLALAPVLLLGL